MAFFYVKAQELDPNVRREDYCYPGPKPRSRETAILMLADGVEGASRALAEPTPSRIRGLVTRIIDERVQEGQLDQCGLTLQELARIRESFIPVLTAIFTCARHPRTPGRGARGCRRCRARGFGVARQGPRGHRHGVTLKAPRGSRAARRRAPVRPAGWEERPAARSGSAHARQSCAAQPLKRSTARPTPSLRLATTGPHGSGRILVIHRSVNPGPRWGDPRELARSRCIARLRARAVTGNAPNATAAGGPGASALRVAVRRRSRSGPAPTRLYRAADAQSLHLTALAIRAERQWGLHQTALAWLPPTADAGL